MSQGSAMRARVDGRQDVARRTAWTLELGGQRLRCLRNDDNTDVELQMRMNGRWRHTLTYQGTAVALLAMVATTIRDRTRAAAERERTEGVS